MATTQPATTQPTTTQPSPEPQHAANMQESALADLMSGFAAARRKHDDSTPVYRVVSPFKEDSSE